MFLCCNEVINKLYDKPEIIQTVKPLKFEWVKKGITLRQVYLKRTPDSSWWTIYEMCSLFMYFWDYDPMLFYLFRLGFPRNRACHREGATRQTSLAVILDSTEDIGEWGCVKEWYLGYNDGVLAFDSRGHLVNFSKTLFIKRVLLDMMYILTFRYLFFFF